MSSDTPVIMSAIPESYSSARYPPCPEYKTKLYEIGAIQDIGYIVGVQHSRDDNNYRITNISDNITKVSWVIEKDVNKLLHSSVTEVFHDVIANTVIDLIQRYQTCQVNYGIENNSSTRTLHVLPRLLCKGIKIRFQNQTICCSVVESKNLSNWFIVEFEELQDDLDMNCPNKKIMLAGNILGKIRATTTVESSIAAFVDSVMELLPIYDRGMVYRYE
jgi:light-regulated signal transduction histidine kinase (bacteriophytochrome)